MVAQTVLVVSQAHSRWLLVFGSHVVVFIKLLNPEQFKLISSLNVIILPPPLALSGRALHPLVSVWVAESLGDSTLGQSRSKEVLRSRR